MKTVIRLLCTCIATLSLYGSLHATYTLTDDDQKTLTSLTNQITTIISDDLSIQYSFVRQLKTLKNTYPDTNTRIHTLLQGLYDHFYGDLMSQKSAKTEARNTSYSTFVRRHESALTTPKALPAACYTYIDDLDMLAFVHDVSLPLLIATRYREFTCGYSLPNNTRGPMQIITKDYGTGPFKNHEQFIAIMEDYIAFSEEKHNRYNRASGTDQPITLSYTNISYADIVKHGALYNGIKYGTFKTQIAPAAPGYVFDHHGSNYATALRDGIMAAAIRIAKHQLSN